jgi:cbb3-type cytochrome oxidase subunit 3
MRRFLLFSGTALMILIVLAWAISYYNTKQKKSFSPEENVVFQEKNLVIKVFYNRPYKKGREIFGGLVPYGVVWRTGANEATTFESNLEINIQGKTLPRGKYTLWTIPDEDVWTVIFNSEFGQWGINADGKANRDPQRDVLTVKIPAVKQEKEFEQFTIAFERVGEEAEMVLFWDTTLVAIPFSF